ncbi:MAG TPA: DUF5995 family protein [Pilimelia sp.]|nr:DUF5995 family protein [Pilimelia sp.]
MQESIAALVAWMEADLQRLRATSDRRRHFHATYLRTTRAVSDEIDRGGFADGAWLERWDVAFADLYLDALAADLRGEAVPRPWRIAFDTARDRPDIPPLRHVLLGMNAHINYDLPQALIAVISPAEYDDLEIRRSRAADHKHVDEVLVARVAAEDVELSAQSTQSLLDRLLRPLNRASSRRILREAREKVWRNTAVLDRARRVGPERYAAVLAELEVLSAARLADLVAPGQVLLKLARRGFGVLLREA